MGKPLLYSLLLLVWTASAAFAMDGCGAGPCAKCHSLTLKEANTLLAGVGVVKKVQLAPVNGLWLLELEKNGRQGVIFMDFGKKNLIAGTVFPLASAMPFEPAAGPVAPQPAVAAPVQGRPTTTVETAPPAIRPEFTAIPLDNSIVIGNPSGKKRLIVFTDPECPFCARLHAELKKLVALEPDLAVYVKMFPLKMHPKAYDKARVVLGGGTRELLDQAFAGAALAPPGAEYGKKAVDDTLKLGASVGIDSTPTLVLPDGRVMPGFKDAAALRKLLRENKQVARQ